MNKTRSLISTGRTTVYWLCLLLLFIMSNGCRSMDNGGGLDWVSVNFEQSKESKSSLLQSISDIDVKTGVVVAVPESESSAETSGYISGSLDIGLQNLVDKSVVLRVPINSPIRLKQIVFDETYTLDDIIDTTPTATCAGISAPFTVKVDDSTKSVFVDMSSCSDPPSIVSIPPTIVSISPTDGETNVDLSASISITFSESLDGTTVTINTSGTACSGSIQISQDNFKTCIQMSAAPSASNDNQTFTITPNEKFYSNTSFSIKVTTDVTDISANHVASEETAGFRTEIYSAIGTLDTTFNSTGFATYNSGGIDVANDVAIDSSNRILVVGNAGADIVVRRYNPDGSPDTSFGSGGMVTYDGTAGSNDAGKAITIDSNGYILVAGKTNNTGTNVDMTILRFDPDGNLDTSFDSDGHVDHDDVAGNNMPSAYGITLDADEKILIAGGSFTSAPDEDLVIWRYNTNGSLDTTSFNPTDGYVWDTDGAEEAGYDIVTDSSGNVVVVGHYNENMFIARYTSTGVLDTNFNGSGERTDDYGGSDNTYGVVIDENDKIVVTGVSTASPAMTIIRYTSSGGLDTSFGSGGIVTKTGSVSGSDDYGYDLTIDDNGNILVTGKADGTNLDMTIWRYDDTGTIDPSFGTSGVVNKTGTAGGTSDTGRAVTIDAWGRVIVVGESNSNMAIWRYE